MLVLVVVLALALAWLLARRFLRLRGNALDWETGRRKARQALRKSSKVYEYFGVSSSEEYFFNSRGVELFCKQWVPLHGAPRAVLFYCHGYGDTICHTFEDVAIKLAAEQFAVVSMDYEGHGLSSGLHCYIRKFSHLVDDVCELSNALRLRPDWAGLPFFLYGESMGGAVAIQVHRRQPQAWAGALLVAPMCKIAEEMMPPPAVVSVLKVLARVFPTWKLVPTKDITEVGFRDPEKRERVRANPVGYLGKPRLSTALQLLLTTEEIGRHLHEIQLPLLVLHGEADVVTNPQLSVELVERCSSRDKTLRLYRDAWHGLTAGEPEDMTTTIMADMISWLRQRSTSTRNGGFGASVGAEKLKGGCLTGVLSDDDSESTVTCS